MTLLKAN